MPSIGLASVRRHGCGVKAEGLARAKVGGTPPADPVELERLLAAYTPIPVAVIGFSGLLILALVDDPQAVLSYMMPTTCPSGSAKRAILVSGATSVSGMMMRPPSSSARFRVPSGSSVCT